MRHAPVTASATSAPCSTRLRTDVRRALARGTCRGSTRGQPLSETLRRFDEPRRRHGERDPEKPFAARAEPAPRHGHDAFLFECAALERGRGEAFGERHPQVQRGPRRLGLEPLGAQDRKSTRLNSSHSQISYAVFCLKKKKTTKSEPVMNKNSTPSSPSTRHSSSDL